jgi:hypothetical protein
MSLFCFLWMPFCYLFWRSVRGGEANTGGVWAVLLGSAAALVQYLAGSFINPVGFGFSRWISGFVDIVSLPVLVPFILCVLFLLLRIFPGTVDFTGFALLWIIPSAAVRAVSWSAGANPVLLALVPLLWTAQAAGIPLFINIIAGGKIQTIIPAGFGVLAMPVLASTAYWAFFSHYTTLGYLLLTAALIPAVISLALAFVKNGR